MWYPESRALNPPVWLARAGVPIDCPPLPRERPAAMRAIKIRRVFVNALHGRATVADVLAVCRQRRLLIGLTELSALEVVRKTLRPVATQNIFESVHDPREGGSLNV